MSVNVTSYAPIESVRAGDRFRDADVQVGEFHEATSDAVVDGKVVSVNVAAPAKVVSRPKGHLVIKSEIPRPVGG